MKRLVLLLLLASPSLQAKDGYSQFYTATPGATPEAVRANRANPPPAMPLVVRFSDDPNVVIQAYARKGYDSIGYSTFTSGRPEKEDGAIKQAQRVEADIVALLNPEFSESVTRVVPVTTPTTQTTYSSGQATAYGNNGSVTAYGTGTSTTQGSTTTYVPRTTNRYEYGAIYFVKGKFNFGAYTRPLNDSERRRLETNSGLVILLVVDDTPAFKSDILPGDILLSGNGIPISNEDVFSQIKTSNAGKTLNLLIDRDGRRVTKSVQLPAAD